MISYVLYLRAKHDVVKYCLEFWPEAQCILHYCMLSYRPEAEEYVELSCQHIGVFYRLSNGAGYRPGCMIFRIHHAEIFLDLEA